MSEGTSGELVAAAARIWASLVEGAQMRLELFALELGEERRRIVDLIVSAVVVALALFLLVLALNVALLVLLWDSHREAVAIGTCVFYAAVAAAAAAFHRRRRRRGGAPFAATSAVLASDQSAVRELL